MRNGPEHKAARIEFSCHNSIFYILAPLIWLKVQSGWMVCEFLTSHCSDTVTFLFVCFLDSTHAKSIHIRHRLDDLDII